MKSGDILRKATELVEGDRERQHGDKLENMNAIAGIWTAILKAAGKLSKDLDAHDAATLLEGLKIARRYTGEHNIDDYVDSTGYAAIAGEMASIDPEDNLIIFPVAPAVAD